jgi:hypothetical protein
MTNNHIWNIKIKFIDFVEKINFFFIALTQNDFLLTENLEKLRL